MLAEHIPGPQALSDPPSLCALRWPYAREGPRRWLAKLAAPNQRPRLSDLLQLEGSQRRGQKRRESVGRSLRQALYPTLLYSAADALCSVLSLQDHLVLALSCRGLTTSMLLHPAMRGSEGLSHHSDLLHLLAPVQIDPDSEVARKQEEQDRLRSAEKFMVRGTGKALCISCGYEYEKQKGDPEYPITPGTEFEVSQAFASGQNMTWMHCSRLAAKQAC